MAIWERRRKTVERCKSALGLASVQWLSWLGLMSMVGRRIWQGILMSKCEHLMAHGLWLIILQLAERAHRGGRGGKVCLFLPVLRQGDGAGFITKDYLIQIILTRARLPWGWWACKQERKCETGRHWAISGPACVASLQCYYHCHCYHYCCKRGGLKSQNIRNLIEWKALTTMTWRA
jgi:hypothetical protein